MEYFENGTEILRVTPRIKRNRIFNSRRPLYFLPAEIKTDILSHCSPGDGIHLAKACRAFGTWAGEELLRIDSLQGDRKGLSHACETDDQALLLRALQYGASANDVFPISRGMSGLNPLALAIISGCSPGFINAVLSIGKVTQAALNSSTSEQDDRENDHFWTDTPLQMALLRAHPKAANPDRNKVWFLQDPRADPESFGHPMKSNRQAPARGGRMHSSSRSSNNQHRLPRRRFEPKSQLTLLEEAVQISTMLIYSGARTANPPPPQGPVWGDMPCCTVTHHPAQFRYHHHRHYFLPPWGMFYEYTATGLPHRPEPNSHARTPIFLALHLAKLDHRAVSPLLWLILDRMGHWTVARDCFSDPFMAFLLGFIMEGRPKEMARKIDMKTQRQEEEDLEERGQMLTWFGITW